MINFSYFSTSSNVQEHSSLVTRTSFRGVQPVQSQGTSRLEGPYALFFLSTTITILTFLIIFILTRGSVKHVAGPACESGPLERSHQQKLKGV